MNKLGKGPTVLIGCALTAALGLSALPDKGADNTTPAPLPLLRNVSPAPVSQVPNPATLFDATLSMQRTRSTELTWGRNLFRPPGESSEHGHHQEYFDEDLPKLSGVSTVNGDMVAIIDHQIVGEGDRLKTGYLIIAVAKGAVELERNDRRIILTLE
ncbi:MAG: hypothetical protein ACYTEP_00490 [Planctomycetota bacterium]|jgi:hypothetical protein